MTEVNKPIKRGRKPVNIEWPDREFTASEVAETVADRLSRVSVHNKLNKAVQNGELSIVRKSEGKMGRPHVVYVKSRN
jgi:response regulator of citrate/malate metabolism|tara:strand:- start:129 stop:362 length:234 start_codon:yes stop_codon:yes gene_type:complete